jgi:hypothetical protein
MTYAVENLVEKFSTKPFAAKQAEIVRGENWSARRINEKYKAAVDGIDDSPKYQRPDCVGFPDRGNGTAWQRALIRDILLGHPIQPLHFRVVKTPSGYEVVDGGHRTRTIVNFLQGNVRTPVDTILVSDSGDAIDISEMDITDICNLHPFLKNYIDSIPFDVYEYHNLSDDAAEELFLKLNDLHDMKPADKRNAINNIIADICREYGAVDSRNAFSMFYDKFTDKTGIRRLRHVELSLSGRETDEAVSWVLYYLYNKGVWGKIGVGSQPYLNSMYRDRNLINRLSDPNDPLKSQLFACLRVMNDVVTNHQLVLGGKKNKKWGVHTLKKLMMCVAESHYNPRTQTYKFDKKINIKKFFQELNSAIITLKNDNTVKHHPHQLYEIIGNTVVPLSKNQQPKTVKYGQTFSFADVFTGGHRSDDLLFCYQHLVVKGLLSFGKKGIETDERRFFSENEADELYIEQGGVCRRCGCTLESREDYQVDHIVPYDVGGITDIRNGQLLCNDCNGKKSSGMHISDVEYVCEKMQYSRASALLDMIDCDVLAADDIKLVVQKLFKS